MRTILARNVNDAYMDGLWWLKIVGKEEETRNGRAMVSPDPVVTVYRNPQERVLFDPIRDANPFFHLAESIWMLAGGRDVATPARFAKQMREYSDDGYILKGAYGFRWRNHFDIDQISYAISGLEYDPTSRRQVIVMYDPRVDTAKESKDIPCNTHIYLRNNQGKLDLTVMCRSNDAVWGAYGANAVHFSMLHEYLANALGQPIGTMYQFSNNFHIYERHWHLFRDNPPLMDVNPYAYTQPMPCLFAPEDRELFDHDCVEFVQSALPTYESAWFHHIFDPIMQAHEAYKAGSYIDAFKHIGGMIDCDWKVATTKWLVRRQDAKSE